MRLLWVIAIVACGSNVKPSPTITAIASPVDAAVTVVDAAVAIAPDSAPVEQPDPSPVTTVKEYTYEPAAKLPAVTGTAAFKPLGKPRVVRFAVNVWPGWAPLVYANDGHKPKKIWKDSRGGEFVLELVLVDSPSTMANSLAAGDLHLGWASVDMLPLLVERLRADPRTMPRVYQLVDWSTGGDGIVVRGAIKQVSDLRGKTIVLAQNSPSHYFLLDTLLDAGVQPHEVKLRFTKDAFQAAAAFNQTRDIDAVVSWAPDIYFLTQAPANRLLVTTALASRAIADVWFARADFAKANPGILEAIVRRGLDAATELQTDANKQTAAKLMEAFFNLPAGTGIRMFADVHLANHADNRAFLLDRNNSTNFQRTYDNAVSLYRKIKVIEKQVAFDQLADVSIIKKLGAETKYARQTTAAPRFTPATSIDLDRAILTKTVAINFFPNSSDLFKKVGEPEAPYDPNVERTIADIAKLASKFGVARIHIGGFTDASMKGMADETLVRTLSEQRATAVKDALVQKHKLDPARLVAQGFGWERPADPQDPDNHAKNRRVEIRVLPAADP